MPKSKRSIAKKAPGKKHNASRTKKAYYPELFKPIKIGNREIKNRIVMAPMNTLFSMDNKGYVNEQILAYYAARAKGGTGLIITECILGTKLASKFPYTTNLHCYNTTHIPGLSEIADTIHAHDCKVFAQMSIGFGRQGHSPDHESPPAPSAIPYQTDPMLMPKGFLEFFAEHMEFAGLLMSGRYPSMARADMPREITKEEIKSEIEEFAESCVLVAVTGIDGIELHAPHGYLEHQFLSPRSNKRTDEYGGSLENRMRFVVEIYEAVRAAIGHSIPVGIRLSGDEHMPDGIHHDELKQVVKRLGEMGVDYVHLSDGSYEALKHFFPDEENLHLVEEAESFKSVLPKDVPVISVSLHDPKNASEAIKKGRIDMVSLGRQMLCDPEWANKVKKGRAFKKCLRCCDCLMRTAIGLPVQCRVNKDLGRERYMSEYWRPQRPKGTGVLPQIPKAEDLPKLQDS